MIEIHTDTINNGRVERSTLTVVAHCECGSELYGTFTGSPCGALADDRVIEVEVCDSCASDQYSSGYESGCEAGGDDEAQKWQVILQELIEDLEEELGEDTPSLTKLKDRIAKARKEHL